MAEYVAPVDVYVNAESDEDALRIIQAVLRDANDRELGFARFALTDTPEAME